MPSNTPILNVVVMNAPITELIILIILDLESDGEVEWAEKVANDMQVEVDQKAVEAHDKAQWLADVKSMCGTEEGEGLACSRES